MCFFFQVIFAFTSPRSYGCQNVQNHCLNRQLRSNRCRRQDSPPALLPDNDNNVNGLTNTWQYQNGRPFGNVPVMNGLQNGLPVNNRLPYGFPVNNGLPTGLPTNIRLPNGFPAAFPINNRFPTSLPFNNGLSTDLPIRSGLPNGLPINNGLPNIGPTNIGLPNTLPNGYGLQNVLPNYNLPINGRSPPNFPETIASPFNNLNLNGMSNGLFNSVPNGGGTVNLPLNGITNNMPTFNNIDGTLGNNQVIQNGVSNNFQNTLPVNNEMPNINNLQNNNSPNEFVTGNLGIVNSFPIQNELPNLNNMKFTYIPRRFDNLPDNVLNNNNNVVTGYPAVDTIQNSNGFQFNNISPPNLVQGNNVMPENLQISNRAIYGIPNYVPNVNYLPGNTMNTVPVFNNWGLANRLPTNQLPLISPEMFINNYQNYFDMPNMPNFLPTGILPNMPIDVQSVLPNNPTLNTLRIEGFGTLPIINGLPVAGITESVTLL